MTLWELVMATGKRLTGAPVIVRNRTPIYKGYDAVAQKTAAGVPVVDLSPTIDNEDFINIFLHEMAHVKLHTFELAATNTQRPPGSTQPAKLAPAGQREYDRRESEADRLAAQWLDYANRNYKNFDGYSVIEKKLLALYNMR